MSYAISPRSIASRGSLLAIVIGVHIAIALMILTLKTVVPAIQDNPLFVDFLPMDAPKPPEIKVQPVKPQVNKLQPAPRIPVPLETTSSQLPANAPSAPPAESKPSPLPTAPAEPAISQPRFDADYLRNPAPSYPPLARRMGEEGKVLLRVLVSPQGTAEAVEIRTSSGSSRLDESAQKTVRTWKFIPAKKGDLAVQSWVLVPIVFKLEQ